MMKPLQTLVLAFGFALAAAGGAAAQVKSDQPSMPGTRDSPGQPGARDQPPPPTQPAVDPLVTELIRKAGAREPESNFCSGVSWPAGNPSSYTAWLEDAAVGANKVNTFKGGADCQFDRVTEVFQRDGLKCVRYTWYACQREKNCGSGSALACKQPGGNWKTEG